MIRVAAVGDLHFGPDALGTLRPALATLPELADVLLIAGDLTRVGEPAEAVAVAEEMADLGLPIIAVLGNHDYHLEQEKVISEILESIGIRVLDGEALVVEIGQTRVGIAGAKGFGGGFLGACGSDFGEPEMKVFIGHTKEYARRLETALCGLIADLRIALLHYSPIEATLRGEHPGVYPFLGSYLLAEAIDRAGADLVIHGHAHGGMELGTTPTGIPVRNVAQPVIGRSYAIYKLE